jgi:hypothetical protein
MAFSYEKVANPCPRASSVVEKALHAESVWSRRKVGWGSADLQSPEAIIERHTARLDLYPWNTRCQT